MNKLFCLLIATMATSMLGGCFNNGSPAPPPTGFIATAGDGRVRLDWTPSPDVNYWVFTATDPSLSAFNWINLPNSHAYPSANTPFYVCGIFSGTPYYFAANGRIDGGPGGPSSATISATPYNASTVTWTVGATPSLIPNLLSVGYTSLTTCSNNATSAAGAFVTVGTSGAIYTSADGMSWAAPTTPPPAFSTDLYAVTGYAANQNNPGNSALRWVAVGAGGASVYSLDGETWAVGNPFNSNSVANSNNYTLHALTQVAGTFLAVGDTGTILSSTDGITWTTQNSGSTNNLKSVNRGIIYTAVGDSGTILTSADGSTWTSPTTPAITATLRQVTSFGSIIVAVGDLGTIVTSKDSGVTWTSQVLTGAPNLVGIAAESQLVINAVADSLLGYIANAQFIAIDNVGNTYTSSNGLTWSAATTTGTTSVNALVSSGFGYVAVGNAGVTASAF